MNRGEKTFRHDAPAMMPFFRPRIGKQQVNNLGALQRQQIFDGIGSFHSQNPHVAQSAAHRFAARAPHPSKEPFDPEKVAFRKSLR